MSYYCPSCKSKKPMVKAGFNLTRTGERQRWMCRSKRCSKITVHPLRVPRGEQK